MRRRALALSTASLMLGCAAEPASVDFRVRGAPPDDPFAGADALVVTLEREGAPLPETERRFAIDASGLALFDLPFGTSLALRVEARLGTVVLARGRSYPFDYPDADHAPVGVHDVLLGTLGRFGRAHDGTGARPLAVWPIEGGARIGVADALLEYRAHTAEGGASLEALVSLPDVFAAAWARLGERAIAAVDSRPALLVFDAGGAIEQEVALPARARTLTTSAEGVVAWLDDGQVLLVSAELELRALGDVGESWPEAAVEVPVRVGDRDESRVVGIGTSDAWIVDPPGNRGVERVSIGSAREGRAVVAIGTGTIALIGGRDDAGTASDVVEVWIVRPERSPALERLSPSPAPLFDARSDAAAVALASRIVLVAGGHDANGALRSAELLDFDVLPGDVVATGPTPFVAGAPRGAALGDRSVLVATAEGLAVYFPPRDP